MTAREIIARAYARKAGNENHWPQWTDSADLTINALAAEGLVIAPREPSEAMVLAGDNVWGSTADHIYRAMLNAHESQSHE